MIPMIDLLWCTISFLLITAVWSHMAPHQRGRAGARPARTRQGMNRSPRRAPRRDALAKTSSSLIWKQGAHGRQHRSTCPASTTSTSSKDGQQSNRYPELAQQDRRGVEGERLAPRRHGQEVRPGGPAHRQRDAVQRHRVGVIDAIYQPKRQFNGAARPRSPPSTHLLGELRKPWRFTSPVGG